MLSAVPSGENVRKRWPEFSRFCLTLIANAWLVAPVRAEPPPGSAAAESMAAQPAEAEEPAETAFPDPDADNDSLPDVWEVLNGLSPLDDGATDPNNGPDGDMDGDGFDNALEYELGAPANNPAWSGEQLAYRFTHRAPPAGEAAREKMLQAVAASDVRAAVRTVPALERMWPGEVEAYLHSAMEAARFLDGNRGRPGVQEALDKLVEAVLGKNCPAGDPAQARVYFDGKNEFVIYCLGFEETCHGKNRLLAVARFLGEARDLMIPNYENRNSAFPGGDILMQAGVLSVASLKDPGQIAAYQKAVEANRRDLAMNDLQLSLSRVNERIAVRLVNCCEKLHQDAAADNEFMEAIAATGRFSAEEQKAAKASPLESILSP